MAMTMCSRGAPLYGAPFLSDEVEPNPTPEICRNDFCIPLRAGRLAAETALSAWLGSAHSHLANPISRILGEPGVGLPWTALLIATHTPEAGRRPADFERFWTPFFAQNPYKTLQK